MYAISSFFNFIEKRFLVSIICIAALQSCGVNKTLDSYLMELETEQKATGTVSIFKDEQEVYNKSIGFADVENKEKNNESSLYAIGSISKTFTAVIILQLVEENKLSLDTKLSNFFPKMDNASKISIENLLQHRSGLFNITNEEGFEVWVSEKRTRAEVLSKIYQHKVLFEVNTQTAYSNTNFILLSYIAEDIENQGFADILQRRISDEIGLKNTFFGNDLEDAKSRVKCYYPENEEWYPITLFTNLDNPMGAGGVTSTAHDVSKFYQALFAGKLLSNEILEQMTTPKKEVGMGIFIRKRKGWDVYVHDGAIDGFRSIAAYFPKENLSIAYTFNASKLSRTEVLFDLLGAYFYTKKKDKASKN